MLHIWHHIKKCIPRSLKNRDPQGYLNQKDLMQYVHRWQWRRSCDIDLFTSLGQACKKLRRWPSKLLPSKSAVLKMLAAVAKRAKLTFFDDPYRSLASNSNKSKKKNIRKTHSFCQCAFQTLDDNVLKRTAPWRTWHLVFRWWFGNDLMGWFSSTLLLEGMIWCFLFMMCFCWIWGGIVLHFFIQGAQRPRFVGRGTKGVFPKGFGFWRS